MNRFLLAFAVLFTFASFTGPTIARAEISVELWSVGSSEQCLESTAVDEAPPPAAFKPCGKKINGLAIPCQPLPGVLPELLVCHGEFRKPQRVVTLNERRPLDVFHGWFRPPRA